MAEIRRLEADAFQELYPALLHPMNPRISREVWRRIFTPPWTPPEPTVGYGLWDPGRGWVGFVGTLRAEVEVAGISAHLCNFTTWTVEPEFRGQSMALVMPDLRRRELTLTNLTPIPEVREIFSRLGFRELEPTRTVLRAPLARGGPERVVSDRRELLQLLDAADRRVMEDHGESAEHLALVDSQGGVCYLMWTAVRRKRLPAARVHHVGNPGVLARGIRALQRHLLTRHGAVFLDMDSRFLGGEEIPGARTVPMAVPRMYRSPTLEPHQVSSAYSELALLNI